MTRLLTRLLLTGIVVLTTICLTVTGRSETPEEWIKLGARTHGAFGAFIPVGIRIGLDALERLNAEPRDVTVVYYDSDKAPCACIADGVALATVATVGQRTLQIASEKAPEGALAIVVVQKKQSGEAVRYTVPDEWLPRLSDWNRTLDAAGRYEAVMGAEGLIKVRGLGKQGLTTAPATSKSSRRQKPSLKTDW